MNKPTYVNRCRRSLLAKQQELVTTRGGRTVLAPAAGLAGADEMDRALAESQAIIDVRVSQARNRLRQAIEWALIRVKNGNYGICTACGNPIGQARLKALPWTDCCRDCVEQQEA